VYVQDEEGVPVELRHLPEYKELLELKRLKKHKLQEIQAESSMALHHGYKVHTSPWIQGTHITMDTRYTHHHGYKVHT
jgi:hypothetical protein